VQGAQHDDPSRDARQLPSGMILSRGTGDWIRFRAMQQRLGMSRFQHLVPQKGPSAVSRAFLALR
jgi:hypothetical protein